MTTMTNDQQATLSDNHNGLRIDRDGNAWCAMLGDFINLGESPVGFGYTIEKAITDLWVHCIRDGITE